MRAVSKHFAYLLAVCLQCALWTGGAPLPADAADQFSEYAVKAAFLYRFAGYAESLSPAPKSPQFTFAVLDSEPVAAELERFLPSHPVKSLPARVRTIKNINELGDAQVLYIGPQHASDLHAIIAAVGARPVLVVSDEEGGLEEGSMVNFMLVDRRVRFEVSLFAAERAGLKISSELLSVAARVQGGHLRSDATCGPLGLPGEPALRCPARMASL